jgi:hypothetical protein
MNKSVIGFGLSLCCILGFSACRATRDDSKTFEADRYIDKIEYIGFDRNFYYFTGKVVETAFPFGFKSCNKKFKLDKSRVNMDKKIVQTASGKIRSLGDIANQKITFSYRTSTNKWDCTVVE